MGGNYQFYGQFSVIPVLTASEAALLRTHLEKQVFGGYWKVTDDERAITCTNEGSPARAFECLKQFIQACFITQSPNLDVSRGFWQLSRNVNGKILTVGDGGPVPNGAYSGADYGTIQVVNNDVVWRGGWPRLFIGETVYNTFVEHGMPVRYIRNWKSILGDVCHFCSKPAENAAHRIPYKRGIFVWRFTPAYLNRMENLVATCHECNKKAELSVEEICIIYDAVVKQYIKENVVLPTYTMTALPVDAQMT